MAKKSLQDELKKKLPFTLAEQEVTLSIWRTSDLLYNRFGRLFREFDLTPSQYNVLRILRGEGRPLPCQEISERMIQVVPAMTGLLNRLEQQGLIERARCSADRRIVFVQLAQKGLDLLQRLDEPVAQLHKQLLKSLSAPQLEQLIHYLALVRAELYDDTVSNSQNAM